MAVRSLLVLTSCLSVALAHYEKPPCASDEVQAQLQGGGELCAPTCSGATCPSDVPTGVKATPKCVLKDSSSGKSYCGLVCKSDTDCATDGATCSMVASTMGICTYKSSGSQLDTKVRTSEQMFSEFAQLFDRQYDTEEEHMRRLEIFTENLATIFLLQMNDPSAQYSYLTPFVDRTLEEFSALSGLRPHHHDTAGAVPTQLLDVSELPESFDWRTKGAVNPVKNQGQCGSCWAFSTVANIEGVNFVKTGKLLSLSEQELVDCDKKTGDEGCEGGLPSSAFKDMIASHLGLELENDYPYTGSDGKCKASTSLEKVFISNWTQISTDEDQIAAALVKYGPLSIGINAGPMQFYHGGVSKPWKIFCNPKKLDHGVAIVGFGVDAGAKYWTIRNSWGPSWGEKGYYRIVRGSGACGLNTMVTTAYVADQEAELLV